MPGFRVHHIFGNIAGVKALVPAISTYPQSFNLGLQGPDIFFFSPLSHLLYGGALQSFARSILKPRRGCAASCGSSKSPSHPGSALPDCTKEHLGGIMHGKNTKAMFLALFNARNQFQKADERAICDAYISGFIGHYTLDTTAHPYVHFRTKKIKNSRRPNYTFGIHVLLETDMDTAALLYYLKKDPSKFRCDSAIKTTKKEQAVISRLLKTAIEKAYPGVHIAPWMVSFAIFCTRISNAWLSDVSGRKKAFLRRIDERLIGNAFFSALIALDFHQTYDDPMNLAHKLWKNPWNPAITSRESLPEMMERAAGLYRRRIALYASMTDKADAKNRQESPSDASDTPRARKVSAPDPKNICAALLAHLGNLSYDTGLDIPTAADRLI